MSGTRSFNQREISDNLEFLELLWGLMLHTNMLSVELEA